MVVAAGSPAARLTDDAVECALARWGVSHGTVLDRRSPFPERSRLAADSPSAAACALRELKQHTASARRLAADCGQRDLLVLPGDDDLIPPEWAETVIRIPPCGSAGSFRADVGSVARELGRSRNDVFRELTSTDALSFTRLIRAERAVLVEGRTDRAVFEVLIRRFALPGIAVVAAHSKVRMAALNLLATRLGVRTYVVFDGDGGPIPTGPAMAHRVARTRRIQTENLLRGLAPQEAGWEFGGPSTAGSRWCAFSADLEAQLSAWPSFMAALGALGEELAAKNHRTLRTAAVRAELEDMPPALCRLRTALAGMVED